MKRQTVQVYLLKAVFSFRDGRALIVQWTVLNIQWMFA